VRSDFHRQSLDGSRFQRAERGSDGAGSFKISAGDPLPTSYREDSYRKSFGRSIDSAVAALPQGHRQ
jgi:hypothetical protein